MKHYQNTLRQEPAHQDHHYTSLEISYEPDSATAWFALHAQPRPCFTPTLLNEIKHWFAEIDATHTCNPLRYLVMHSNIPGVFNLGGDLNLFSSLIRRHDREGLLNYAIACIDALYLFHTGLNRNVTSISLIQGDALGGGLEAALAGDVLIAERGTKMGFPEILFNLFPGMGAYSFLSRKVGSSLAESMILGGRLYTAEELYEMGVVDQLAAPGMGRQAVYDYIKRERRAQNGFQAFRRAKQYCNPVTYEELLQITTVWADSALNISERDLRTMERLIARQNDKI